MKVPYPMTVKEFMVPVFTFSAAIFIVILIGLFIVRQ
jgi:hypothetical protein